MVFSFLYSYLPSGVPAFKRNEDIILVFQREEKVIIFFKESE
jgi:hypothetical protein